MVTRIHNCMVILSMDMSRILTRNVLPLSNGQRIQISSPRPQPGVYGISSHHNIDRDFRPHAFRRQNRLQVSPTPSIASAPAPAPRPSSWRLMARMMWYGWENIARRPR
jgi:hypothetical protein